jgi:hypothetical protein
MTTMKPLFIPLLMRWFDAFKNGSKVTEYRTYGPRWNERTCIIGRAVVLSGGYGKKHRLRGEVVSFNRNDDGLDPVAEIGIKLTESYSPPVTKNPAVQP